MIEYGILSFVDELPDLAEIAIPVETETSENECIKVCLSLRKKCKIDAEKLKTSSLCKFDSISTKSRRILKRSQPALRRRRDLVVETLRDYWNLSVSQLRGHWEDTSNKVHSRKNQLEELAADHRHFEVKCQEIDAWLNRMEAWQARQRPIGNTKDQLEQQSRELKVNAFKNLKSQLTTRTIKIVNRQHYLANSAPWIEDAK